MTRTLAACALLVFACGPSTRHGSGDDDGTVDSSTSTTGGENTPTACSDGIDNDGDGLIDCADPDCSGIGSCPVCGQVDHPLSTPLALPDGVGMTKADNGHADDDPTCTSDTTCATGEHCFTIPGDDKECRSSYIATLHYMSFAQGQMFAAGDLQQVCVNMEHSWLRDLQIDLVAPSGQILQLQRMLGRTCPSSGDACEIYLGQANDCDSDAAPVPGVGAMYCWAPTATKPAMLDFANNGGTMDQAPICMNGGTTDEMPPDTYSAADPWSTLVGASLNGDWELRVTDLWPADNGYIFSWSMTWNPMAITDCTGPIIE